LGSQCSPPQHLEIVPALAVAGAPEALLDRTGEIGEIARHGAR
jgi:hypothetical protein